MIQTAFAATESAVPQSFSTAVNQLNAGNFDAAESALQQTIKTLPNSVYAYRSYVLEAVILRTKMFWMSQTFGGLIAGLQAKNSSKLSDADKTYLTTQAKTLLNLDTKTYYPQYITTVEHVVKDMPGTELTYKYNLAYKHVGDDAPYLPMDAFKQSGYPAITKAQLTKYETANQLDGFVYFESVVQQGMPQTLYDFAVGVVQNEPDTQSGLSVINSICQKIKALLKTHPDKKLSSEVDAILKTAQSN